MEALKNKLWIWGHPTNSLKGIFGLTKTSTVSVVDAVNEFGAVGAIYVPMGRPCYRPSINADMHTVKKTGWSMESEKDVLDLIEQKKEWDNLKIGIYDDFFSEANAQSNFTQYSVEKMIELREKMHEAGLEMWVVFYTMQIDLDVWKDYLKVFDGVTLWLWDEPTNEEFDEKCKWFFKETEGQRRMIGCYLYNFGKEKEATKESVRYQLDRNLEFVKDNKIEGIILHTNVVGGMSFEAYDEAKLWVKEHGEELV